MQESITGRSSGPVISLQRKISEEILRSLKIERGNIAKG
jgi:hypothetical protein